MSNADVLARAYDAAQACRAAVVHFSALEQRIEALLRVVENRWPKVARTAQNGMGGRAREVTNKIIGEIAKALRRSPDELTGKHRHKGVAHDRFIAVWVVREATGFAWQDIGHAFGGRDHSTMLHAYRTLKNRRAKDISLMEFTDELLKRAKAA
jgi:chromosomal replication initiation ATPase DnaA